MAENILTQVTKKKEEIERIKGYRDYAEFCRKRSLYQDHFFDAEKHEWERDGYQELIDKLRSEIKHLTDDSTRNGSYYIQCQGCEEFVHQRRTRTHKCKVTPVSRRIR
jgi:hypothetical protein